jgi:Protein of unknown function (DUF1286)
LKEFTHYAFSIGVLFYILDAFHRFSLPALPLSLWISTFVNLFIDKLGHRRSGDHSVRSWSTHSIFTAPVWGATIGFASIWAVSRLVPLTPLLPTEAFWASLGAIIALGHLFLDSLTEGGIYRLKDRMAIAHFRFDNLALNAGFTAFGLLLAVVSLLRS